MPFNEGYQVPEALDQDGIVRVIRAFADATRRAVGAGARIIELHAAHGYLLHEFLSPLSNKRDDRYGGSFDNRTRFLRETVEAVRAVLPDGDALFVRISGTDWADGGWTVEDSVALCAAVDAARRRRVRLFLWRTRPVCPYSRGRGLSGSPRRTRPQGDRDADCCRRSHHRARAGRADCAKRPG